MMKRFRNEQKWPYVLLVLLLLSAYAYFLPRWADWNQNSRLDVVLAIVDQGTLAIDAYVENTGDYALFEGHYYGEKAPGTSLLGVPVYAAFKLVFGGWLTDSLLPRLAANPAAAGTLTEGGRGLVVESLYFALALYFVTFFTVALPSALLGAVFYHFLGYLSNRVLHRVLLTLAYGLGTIAFPYSGSYYGHQLTAVLLFFAFWLLFRIRRGELNTRFLWLAGFLLGYSAITEYPTVFVAAALFFYAVYFLERKWQASWMVISGLVPVIGLLLYNTAIFGAPWEFSYKYSELWVDYHHTGFFGTTLPDPRALWGITFSPYRGLFFLSPLLLLTIPGFYVVWRRRDHRPEVIVSLAIVASILLFNSASKMWFGGHSVGPRYLIPALPFLAWPIIGFLDRYGRQAWGKVTFAVLTTVSLVFIWVETISGQGFPQYSPNPLFDYSLPLLLEGDIARNLGTIAGLPSWYSLLPLLLLMGVLLAILARLSGRIETSGRSNDGP